MTVVLVLIQFGVAAMLVTAAAGKAVQSDQYVAALRLSYLPEWAVKVVAVGLPILEVGIALRLLLTPPEHLQAPFVLTILLLLVFTLWMVWVDRRGLTVRCGCFGGGEGKVGTGTITRNVILILIAAAGWWLAGRFTSPLPGMSWPTVVAATSALMIVALVQAFRMVQGHLVISEGRLPDGGE